MTEQRDDDALTWAGDDDPTLDPSGSGEAAGAAEPDEALDLREPPAVRDAVDRAPADPGRPVTAEVPVVPKATDPAVVAAPGTTSAVPTTARKRSADAGSGVHDPAEREQMSSAMLVTLGIFGGVFLLYSVGWLISAFRPDAAVPDDTVGEFMFNLGQGLAVAAGPVWMAATLWLTRGSKPYVRIAMLALGVLLVLPWPFLRGV